MSHLCFALLVVCALALPAPIYAQDAHQHHAPASLPPFTPENREGSGTSWLPDATPMFAVHGPIVGGWRTMLHGVAYLQYLRDEKPRGTSQVGSVNWVMGHARRTAGGGELVLRGMLSAEPLTIRGCGFPVLLASGEVCDGQPIVDKQHPHDAVMELSAHFTRPLSSALALQAYGGLAGEPALGPVAFPHRVSAMSNPVAPVSHHWLDATHITYGVVTAGVLGQRWKVEGSVFNGREPDDERGDLDLNALDSYAGRIAYNPASHWSLQISAGHLEEAEEHNGGREDVERITASVLHHRSLAGGGDVATTAAWGRNREDDDATHAFLIETAITPRDRHSVFVRAEWVQKTGHDLALEEAEDEHFGLSKLQLGYTWLLPPARGWQLGLGGSGSIGLLPSRLAAAYGGRAPLGAAAFLVLRPGRMTMNSAMK